MTCCQQVFAPTCCPRDYSSDSKYYGCFFRAWSVVEAVHSTKVWRTCPGNRWVFLQSPCKCVDSNGSQIDPGVSLLINGNGFNEYTGQPIGSPNYWGAINISQNDTLSGSMSGARSRQLCEQTLQLSPAPTSAVVFGSMSRYRLNSNGTDVVSEPVGFNTIQKPILPGLSKNNGFPQDNIAAAACGVSAASAWHTFDVVSSFAQKSIVKVWGQYNVSKWSVYYINNNGAAGSIYLWVRSSCSESSAPEQGQFVYSEDTTSGLGLETMEPVCTELGSTLGQLVNRFTNIQKDVACSNLAP